MQPKLKLNLEDLKVESFDTSPGGQAAQAGTVFGLSIDPNDTQYYGCVNGTEANCTGGYTCQGETCWAGCPSNDCETASCVCETGNTCGQDSECAGTCAFDSDCTACVTHICC
jgi:hypothetical protein